MSTAAKAADLAQRAATVGTDLAAPAAADVDRQARFPHETVEGLHRSGLLGAAVPAELGGEDASLEQVAGAVQVLSRSCASSGMVYAMHQIQVFCLIRHGANDALRAVLRSVAADGLLLASATTEAGVGGDVRTSICALQTDGEDGHHYRLRKQAPVISYGEHAGGVLATARRTADSPSSDQVLVCCLPPGLALEPTSEWDTLGFRGTASRGFLLTAAGDTALVLTDTYGDISAQTMLPVAHLLWSSVWLGLAESAAEIAHHYVRSQGRRQPGNLPPSATRLAELASVLQQMRGLVAGALVRYQGVSDDAAALGSLPMAVAMNSLKVSASTLVVDIVGRALGICGMAGYRQDSPHSLGRHLRDAYGAMLMVNNDRVTANSAQLLLASKEI